MKSAIALVAALQLATIAILCFSSRQVDAAVKWPSEYMNDAKDFVLEKIKNHVINQSKIVETFQQTMEKVKTRYAIAEASGELDNMDETEQQAFYYKIVIEETKKLRDQAQPNGGAVTTISPVVDGTLPREQQEILQNLELDKVVDDAEEDLLKDELDTIATEEAEMGWSMTPEAKAAMKERSKKVITDLMSNEIRQLALAVLSSYFTGGPISGVITTAVTAGIKFKLVEYLMNIVVDVLSSVMGRDIKITPAAAGRVLRGSQMRGAAPMPRGMSGPVRFDIIPEPKEQPF